MNVSASAPSSAPERKILGPGGTQYMHPEHKDMRMAPNYVFNCAYGMQCDVNWLTPAAMHSCADKPAICLDAVNRGLLSGLQAPIKSHESVFDDEILFIKTRRELEEKILQGGTDVYRGLF